ncbi:hypothetical protein [Bacillus cereus]|uniref:hypothetical protein n=1 Tax=Bacillus cereus TaxID=1396 RepID=UPI00168177F9|nr:hypothetical protein [Bacillus cereus]
MLIKHQFLDLNEGDCIYIYSGGDLQSQGRYINVVEDKNQSFLHWRNHEGKEIFTNVNSISIETMNENTKYMQNASSTCARNYNNVYNQNPDSAYHQANNYTVHSNQHQINLVQNGGGAQNYDNGYNQNPNNVYHQTKNFDVYLNQHQTNLIQNGNFAEGNLNWSTIEGALPYVEHGYLIGNYNRNVVSDLFEVKPNTRYKLEFDIRNDSGGAYPISIALVSYLGQEFSREISCDSREWKTYSFDYITGPDIKSLYFQIQEKIRDARYNLTNVKFYEAV